jgi:hypothetical protein
MKPGLLFAGTASGGTLLDVLDNRYIALTPISAMIWSALCENASVDSVLLRIMELKGIARGPAESLLLRQLSCWKTAKLTDTFACTSDQLPTPVTCAISQVSEISSEAVAQHPLSLSLLIELWATELRYRHALQKIGLAATLVRLQQERERHPVPDDTALLRTLRSYYALRRPYKQGQNSRDCLPRSLGLSAVFRRHSIRADLCIGVVDMPFSAHAWVEGRGFVLNETLDIRKKYTVIARF